MARARTRRVERAIKMRIYETNFEILPASNTRPTAAGIGILKYTIESPDSDERKDQTAMNLISAWVDKEKGNMIRAHLIFDRRIPSQVKFFKLLLAEGMVPGNRADYHMQVTCDTNGIVRYGRSPDHPYAQTPDHDYHKDYIAYDSKGKALYDLLYTIDRSIPIAGLKLVNLATVPDEVLLEIGYQRVPDELHRSVDMWLGNPKWVLKSSDDSYGYGGVTAVYKKNCQSVLAVLAKHWAVAG